MDIYQEIRNERKQQDIQWGGPEHDDKHKMIDWIGLILKQLYWYYYQKDKSAILYETLRPKIVCVAALAVAMIEWIDRKNI